MATQAQHLFEIQNGKDYSLIRFFGYVDAATVEQFRPLLQSTIPAACGKIIVDLEKVEFLDSHGVGLFVSLLKRAHANRGHLYIAASEGQPSSVLDMVGLNGDYVSYCPDVETALKNATAPIGAACTG